MSISIYTYTNFASRNDPPVGSPSTCLGCLGEYVDRIGFDDLVKLYVNHRPVFAVGPEQIKQAFLTQGMRGKQQEDGNALKFVEDWPKVTTYK